MALHKSLPSRTFLETTTETNGEKCGRKYMSNLLILCLLTCWLEDLLLLYFGSPTLGLRLYIFSFPLFVVRYSLTSSDCNGKLY